MVLLNVVCFGDRDDYIHGHVLSAQGSAIGPGIHLDKWPARPEQGMLERPALITYMPAHGGWLEDGTRVLWVKEAVAPFSKFGIIGGSAVVLDACCTASDDWLYDHDGRLRAECRSLAGKPLLGGSGNAKPQKSHGKWILGELADVLSGVEDADMSEGDLLALLTEVWDRAATKARKAAHNSTLRKAYRARLVTEELHR
jgi:hypothetical protein